MMQLETLDLWNSSTVARIAVDRQPFAALQRSVFIVSSFVCSVPPRRLVPAVRKVPVEFCRHPSDHMAHGVASVVLHTSFSHQALVRSGATSSQEDGCHAARNDGCAD